MSGLRVHRQKLQRLRGDRAETQHLIAHHAGLVLAKDRGKSQQQALGDYERQIAAVERHIDEQQHRENVQ